MKKHPFSPLALLIPVALFSVFKLSPACSQEISERFDKMILSENFDSIGSYWTTMANAENLFIVQDGEYILQRKSTAAPYAIIANFEESFSNFRVVTSLKLDKSLSDDAYTGFMFMIQPQGSGGFLLEINKNREYRLRQIVNGTYKYITGNSKSGGWIKNSQLNEPNFANMIEIRNISRTYDLYINNVFVQTFSEPAYKSGKMGLIIGPSSRAKIDFMYVFSVASPSETAVSSAQTATVTGDSNAAGPDIIELAESIIKLKTQINTLNEENEDLRKTISAMRSGDQEKEVTVKNFEKQVKSLQAQLADKENAVDSLKKINTELMKYKELAGGNENADLIIILSKALKSEKEKNAVLEQELKEMRSKNGSEKSGTPKSAPKSGKTDPGQSTRDSGEKKDPEIFKLPEGN